MTRRDGDAGFTLLELMIAGGILTIVMVIVTSFLISAGDAVAAGTARAADNRSAQTALTLLEANIRFASNLSISSTGTTMFVANIVANEPACAEWTVTSTGSLTEQTRAAATANVITTGVALANNLAYFTPGSSGYQGLVTVSFAVTLAGNATRDKGGAQVLETVSAENMTTAVGTTPQACTLS